jgi:nanoRNase/pAp phosphatase (c-di-AMP/oligoRNAs hydrolase)
MRGCLVSENLKNVVAIMQKISPNDCIIMSHADHDGFSASVLLNAYFVSKYGIRAKILYPFQFCKYYEILKSIKEHQPKYLIIVDSPLQHYTDYLSDILEQTIIINLDHHDILHINDSNFIDCNPHLDNIEFLNSSALVWKILMNIDRDFFSQRCWVGGIGAAQDYCLEDSSEMFDLIRKMGLIDRFDLESVITSKLMSLAKIVRASIAIIGPEYTYDSLLDACLKNNTNRLLNQDAKLSLALQKYREELSRTEDFLKDKYNTFSRDGLKIKFCNLYFSSINFVSDICEREKDQAVYIAYKDGKVVFRCLFVPYDVRPLATFFGGGGPNSRAAGARTTLSYNETIERVLGFLEQRTLF